jgi:hypothetical protein
LNSSVYCRFGTDPFAISFSVHQNIIKILMYVESGQGQLDTRPTPGYEPYMDAPGFARQVSQWRLAGRDCSHTSGL